MKYRFRNWRNDAEAIASASRNRTGSLADVVLSAIKDRCGTDIAVYAATSVEERIRFEHAVVRSGMVPQDGVSRLGERYCRRVMPRRKYLSMALFYRAVDRLVAM